MTYPQQWRRTVSTMRLATVLSIVVPLILITPLAFASPPDPSWIAGIYDGADGDDVVTLLYEIAAARLAARPDMVPALWLPEISRERVFSCLPDTGITDRPRAPPYFLLLATASAVSEPPDIRGPPRSISV